MRSLRQTLLELVDEGVVLVQDLVLDPEHLEVDPLELQAIPLPAPSDSSPNPEELKLVGRQGIEPWTLRLKVSCSAN